MPKRILFVTASRIGDAVLSTGLLDHLLTRHPEARPTIAAGPAAAPLFEAVPRLEQLLVVRKRRHGLHWLDLWRAVVGRRWSVVVDLRGSGLSFFLRAGKRRIAAKGGADEHRVVQLGRLFGLDPPPAPRLWLAPEHETAARALVPPGGPLLVLGPTANWASKQWRPERFAALAQHLTRKGALLAGARIAVLGAANERDQAAPLLAALPPDSTIDLVGRTPLLVAAAILRRAALYVGNDSGLTHIAAAVGAPTLALFGPSPPARYAPWGARAAIVSTSVPYEALVGAPDFDHRIAQDLMATLSVDAALAGAERLLRQAGTVAV